MRTSILWTVAAALFATSVAWASQGNRVEGRVLRASKGEILLERAIDPHRTADVERLGFRKIQSLKEAKDKTILGDHIFVLYFVNTDYSVTFRPEQFEGQKVSLELERDIHGYPEVIHVRLAP